METKHTATPWKWVGQGILINDADTEIHPGELFDEPNAAFILQAVNSHASLVEALENNQALLKKLHSWTISMGADLETDLLWRQIVDNDEALDAAKKARG